MGYGGQNTSERERESGKNSYREGRRHDKKGPTASLGDFIEITSPETITFQPDSYCPSGLNCSVGGCHDDPLISINQAILPRRA
jgi:hypothetical protein